MPKIPFRSRPGFTLIEIMIVVLIIGILLAIALPNFIRTRESTRAKSCVGNLKQIDVAKEQWAMDNQAPAGATAPSLTALSGNGSTTYLRAEPLCPSGGTYSVGTVANNPTCSVTGTTTGVGPLAHSLTP